MESTQLTLLDGILVYLILHFHFVCRFSRAHRIAARALRGDHPHLPTVLRLCCGGRCSRRVHQRCFGKKGLKLREVLINDHPSISSSQITRYLAMSTDLQFVVPGYWLSRRRRLRGCGSGGRLGLLPAPSIRRQSGQRPEWQLLPEVPAGLLEQASPRDEGCVAGSGFLGG